MSILALRSEKSESVRSLALGSAKPTYSYFRSGLGFCVAVVSFTAWLLNSVQLFLQHEVTQKNVAHATLWETFTSSVQPQTSFQNENSMMEMPQSKAEPPFLQHWNFTDVGTNVEEERMNSASMAIFYNIFVPSGEKRLKNALRIVQEQMQQIRHSLESLAKNNISLDNSGEILSVKVFYNTIGSKKGANECHEEIQTKWCILEASQTLHSAPSPQKISLQCQRIGHYSQGSEDLTLQSVHSYCWSLSSLPNRLGGAGHHHKAVVYLHNKGSFHNRGKSANDHWRQHLTAAALHADCLRRVFAKPRLPSGDQSSDEEELCQLCGLLFQTLPTPHYPGNMWAASCDYVNLLPALATYSARLQGRVIPRLRRMVDQNFLTAELYSNGTAEDGVKSTSSLPDWSTGEGRYQWEHWIASHPRLDRPCDMSQTNNLQFWKDKPCLKDERAASWNPSQQHYQWSYAPRHRLMEFHWKLKPRPNKVVLKSVSRRARDYHLLPGLIVKWRELYREVPWAKESNSTLTPRQKASWVWSHYPDGPLWKSRVAKFGLEVVPNFLGDLNETLPPDH